MSQEILQLHNELGRAIAITTPDERSLGHLLLAGSQVTHFLEDTKLYLFI
jgi:hypothetical protein